MIGDSRFELSLAEGGVRLRQAEPRGQAALLAGDHNITVDALCSDVPHLNTLLREGIQIIDGVESVTTNLVTDVKYTSSMNITGPLRDDEDASPS